MYKLVKFYEINFLTDPQTKSLSVASNYVNSHHQVTLVGAIDSPETLESDLMQYLERTTYFKIINYKIYYIIIYHYLLSTYIDFVWIIYKWCFTYYLLTILAHKTVTIVERWFHRVQLVALSLMIDIHSGKRFCRFSIT